MVGAVGVELAANGRQHRALERRGVWDDDGVGRHVEQIAVVVFEVLHGLLYGVEHLQRKGAGKAVALNEIRCGDGGVRRREERHVVGRLGRISFAAHRDALIKPANQHICGKLLSGAVVAGGKNVCAALDFADFCIFHHLLRGRKRRFPGGGFDGDGIALAHSGFGIGAVFPHIGKVAQRRFAGVNLCKVACLVHEIDLVDHGLFAEGFNALFNDGLDRGLRLAENAVV